MFRLILIAITVLAIGFPVMVFADQIEEDFYLELTTDPTGQTFALSLSLRQEFAQQGGKCYGPWREMKFVDLYHDKISLTTSEGTYELGPDHMRAVPGRIGFYATDIPWHEEETLLIKVCNTTQTHCTTIADVPFYLNGERIEGMYFKGLYLLQTSR